MSVDVDLHEIKSTIVQLFFSTIIYQENIRILQNLLGELRKQNDIIEAQVKNGLVLKSNSLVFKMQMLTTEQQILSAELEQGALLDMLSDWTGTDISTTTQLQIPETQMDIHESEINRPEIRLLKSQNLYMESMKKLSSVGNRPMLWAVAQAGVGQPNTYNMLETDFSDFYFVGVKMSWQLFDYGNARREKGIYTAKQGIVNSKLEFFEDNIDRQLTREYAEVDKLNELISKDEEMLEMQKEIVESAFSQLNNGVITSTEYMDELNNKTQLELNRQIHLVQLKQAQYQCLNISGNL
jgi:outer membrane protein TolC